MKSSHIKRIFVPMALVLLTVLLMPSVAFAWNVTGHKVAARIAWKNMRPLTRKKIVATLKAAPVDSGIPELCKGSGIECIENVSIWADQIRSPIDQTRRKKYSHPTWHYRSSLWESTESGPKDRPDIQPDTENAVERLYYFQNALSRPASDEDKAIMIAWVLHIVGDIHQPLHCSGRITETEPKGDAGGNGFKLGEHGNLHSYWDGIVDRVYPRNADETDGAYYGRLVATISKANPRNKFSSQMKADDFEGWANEGLTTAKASLYPASLKRNQLPDADYQKMAYSIAETAVAAAGYRLAKMLNRLFRQ